MLQCPQLKCCKEQQIYFHTEYSFIKSLKMKYYIFHPVYLLFTLNLRGGHWGTNMLSCPPSPLSVMVMCQGLDLCVIVHLRNLLPWPASRRSFAQWCSANTTHSREFSPSTEMVYQDMAMWSHHLRNLGDGWGSVHLRVKHAIHQRYYFYPNLVYTNW